MKLQRHDEYRVYKVRGMIFAELYEARRLLYETAKVMNEKCGRYPTHVVFPARATYRFDFIRQFVARHGAAVSVDIEVGYDEVWIGYIHDQDKVNVMPKWATSPSLRPESVREVPEDRQPHNTVRGKLTPEQIGYMEANQPSRRQHPLRYNPRITVLSRGKLIPHRYEPSVTVLQAGSEVKE